MSILSGLFSNPTLQKKILEQFRKTLEKNNIKKILISIDENNELQTENVCDTAQVYDSAKFTAVPTERHDFLLKFFTDNKALIYGTK